MTIDPLTLITRLVAMNLSDNPPVRIWLTPTDLVDLTIAVRRAEVEAPRNTLVRRICNIPISNASILSQSRLVYADGVSLPWQTLLALSE